MSLNDSQTDHHHPVTIKQSGTVAVITLPAAPLDKAIRRSLATALDSLAVNPSVGAVILTGAGALYAYGAPATDRASPALGEICEQIERFGKPVVSAMQSSAFGQGVELALAAHWRVAAAEIRLGLSEIKLGLVPGAGATQRLPRLIGAANALRLLQSGETIATGDALTLGLLDEVAKGDLEIAAMAAAQSLLAKNQSSVNRGHRTTGLSDFAGHQAAIAVARVRLATDLAALPAAHRMVDCVEAALLLPIEQGLAYEGAAREALVDAPEVQGLSHAARVERWTLRRSALSVGPSQRPTRVAIFGTVATELVTQILSARLHLRLVEPDRDRLVTGLGRIAAYQEAQVQSGRLTPEARDADWARLIPTLTQAEAADADLWLCAQDARVGPVVGTSPPRAFLGGVPADQSGVGLYPAKSAGMAAEICVPRDVDGSALALGLGQALGWRMVISSRGGGIERRLRASLNAAISAQEATGLSRPVLAMALAHYGLGLPLAPQDKTGPAEAVEVANACLCALANEGARLVGEGIALCPGDVDVVAFLSGLVPRRLGGPMNWADQRGLLVLRADLRHRAASQPALFTPAPLIERLIQEERHFIDLNLG